jgi:hypothetical protein
VALGGTDVTKLNVGMTVVKDLLVFDFSIFIDTRQQFSYNNN